MVASAANKSMSSGITKSTSSHGTAPSEQSDAELLLAYCMEGRKVHFETLVRRYQRELFGYLRGYLGETEAAEDVFQQTFLQIHLKRDQFEPTRRFRPWLYTIATNLAIDYKRRHKRHRMASLDRSHESEDGLTRSMAEDLEADEPSPSDQLLMSESNEAVQAAVDSLPEISRQVVLLVYFQGLKYREAAEILDVPVGTVKSRLHGAIKQLAAALQTPRAPR